MMQKFRTFGATKASKALLVVLILAFAAWGIESYLHNQTGAEGLAVNGQAIPLSTVERTYETLKRQAEQMTGQPLTPAEAQELQLPEITIAQLVQQTLARQQAAKLELEPAVAALQAAIRNEPAFADETGQFNAGRYRAVLQQAGLSVQGFEEDLKQREQTALLGGLLQSGPAPLPAAVAPQVAEATGRTSLRVLTLPPSLLPTPKLTDAEVESFYQANLTRYTTPETRSFSVVSLNPAVLAKNITLSAEQIAAEYAASSATYALPETRRVRHILLPSEASATQAGADIRTEADFAAAANRFSTDPGNQGTRGGDLGVIAAADVVPAFAEVAFSLPAGVLSSPTQTNFGWHLIWVSEIRPGGVPPLAEVSGTIAQGLREAEAQAALDELAAKLDDALTAGQSLTEVAKANGLAPLSFTNIKANDATAPEAVRTAAFATEAGQAAAPFSLSDGSTAYLQVTAVSPATPKPLASVLAQVRAEATAATLQTRLQAEAGTLLATLRGNPQAAVPPGVQTGTKPLLHSQPGEDVELLAAVRAQPVGSWLPAPVRDGESWQLIQVQSRSLGQPTAEDTARVAEELADTWQRETENLLLSDWFVQAEVKLNQQRLTQLFGRPVQWQAPQR